MLSFLFGGGWWFIGAAGLAAVGGFLSYTSGNLKWIAYGVSFGLAIGYVGVLKGEISSLNSTVTQLSATNAK